MKCRQLGHHIKDCPAKPSPGEQKRLSAQFRLEKENKFAKPSHYIKLATISNFHLNESRFVKVILAMECLYAKVDSGADATIISGSIVDQLKPLCQTIFQIPLNEHIILEMPNGDTVNIDKAIEINITLETKLGQLIVPHQKCLIWNTLNDDIILGNDMLSSLGITPKNALDSLIAENASNDASQPLNDYASWDKEQSYPDVGNDDQDEIMNALKEHFKEAFSNGMSSQYSKKLLELLIQRHVFGKKLGPDEPAHVTPFKTNLIEGAKPVRCKARQYTKEQSDFLFEFTNLLKQFGLIYENYNAEWASPVQVVKKEKGFRMVVDLRAVNAQCEPTAWPMPFLESIVQYLSSSKMWFILDAFKSAFGYHADFKPRFTKTRVWC